MSRGSTPWSIAAELPRDRNCASVARQLLQQTARADLDDRQLEDASLIVSELATNAFRHGQGTIVMAVRRYADRLCVEIRDEGNPPWIDVVPESQRDSGGYGLWLVSQLASDWGIQHGTSVWAELSLSR